MTFTGIDLFYTEVKDLWHISAINQTHLPSQTGHMSFGSGLLRKRIESGSGAIRGRSPLYSEPLIGSERSHDFGRGSTPNPLPIRSRSAPEICQKLKLFRAIAHLIWNQMCQKLVNKTETYRPPGTKHQECRTQYLNTNTGHQYHNTWNSCLKDLNYIWFSLVLGHLISRHPTMKKHLLKTRST